MPSNGFRVEIQGLRAVAVVLVVLFHAQVPGFSGGFVGVDVFFAVSGFVIASSLIREIDRTGGVRLFAFYGRRIRRLLPAFAFAAGTTLLAVNLLWPIGEAQQAATASGVAAVLSVANIHLMRSPGGYFASDDALNPFLHTWSLGVEEQFYLIAPAVVLLAVRLAPRTRWSTRSLVGTTFFALSAASLALATHWMAAGNERSAFFSPAARFWEIGFGVVLAAVLGRRQLPASRPLCWAAMVALAATSVLYQSDTPFPGLAATPVVGATLLLLAGLRNVPELARALATPPAVWIGDRSYGWYLWHWPCVVVCQMLWTDSWWTLLAVSVLSLLPADLSYRFIETPIRNQRQPGSRHRIALGCLASALFVLAAGSGVGARQRWGITHAGLTERDGIAYTSGCFFDRPWNEDACTFKTPGARGQVLLLGDSHAASLADGVIEAAHPLGLDVVVVAKCPVISGVKFHLDECGPYDSTIDRLIGDPNTLAALIAHRSTRYVAPPISAPGGEDRTITNLATGATPSHFEAVMMWAAGLADTRARFAAHDVPLVQFDVVPEFRSAFNMNLRVISPTPAAETVTVEEVAQRRGLVVAAEHAVLGRDSWIDPAEALCSNEVCSSTDSDGNWLYFDDSHLSRAGSILVGRLIAPTLDSLTTD